MRGAWKIARLYPIADNAIAKLSRDMRAASFATSIMVGGGSGSKMDRRFMRWPAIARTRLRSWLNSLDKPGSVHHIIIIHVLHAFEKTPFRCSDFIKRVPSCPNTFSNNPIKPLDQNAVAMLLNNMALAIYISRVFCHHNMNARADD